MSGPWQMLRTDLPACRIDLPAFFGARASDSGVVPLRSRFEKTDQATEDLLIVTDKFPSYRAAMTQLGVDRRQGLGSGSTTGQSTHINPSGDENGQCTQPVYRRPPPGSAHRLGAGR